MTAIMEAHRRRVRFNALARMPDHPWEPVALRCRQLGLAAQIMDVGSGDVLDIATENRRYVWLGVCPLDDLDGPWLQARDCHDGVREWGFPRHLEQAVGGYAYAYAEDDKTGDTWYSDYDFEPVGSPGDDDSLAEAAVRVARRLLVAPCDELV